MSPMAIVRPATPRPPNWPSRPPRSPTGLPPRLPDRVVGRLLRRGEPAGHGHLLPGVEVDALDTLDVQVAEERLVPAGEGEPRHRGRHPDVDADHPRIEMLLEL